MMRLTKRICCLGLALGLVGSAGAFSLIGPFKPWQLVGFGGLPLGLGYSLLTDIGGPMTPLEGYRWNVPVITYAFDPYFLRYFGTNGAAEVEKALDILSKLPKASAMSESLTEFPLDSTGLNDSAAELRLLDLKSMTLSALLEELGLANPERFVWGLRNRTTQIINQTNYLTVQLNYDPVTIAASRYVNGVLYNYRIFDDLEYFIGQTYASAVEYFQLDPLFLPFTSVAGGIGNPDFELRSSPVATFSRSSGLRPGRYYRGLTRDDAGGLRFLLSSKNYVVETLLPTVVPNLRASSSGDSPWNPFPVFTNTFSVTNVVSGTNSTRTNFIRFVQTAVRPGINKLKFKKVSFDGGLGGTFTPLTNSYTDTYLDPSTGQLAHQEVQRVITTPDITFSLGDLAFNINSPVTYIRTDTSAWINNSAKNTAGPRLGLGGPGTIVPPVVITFTDLLPSFLHNGPGQDTDAFETVLWGSFDGTDKPPVVYPINSPWLSLQYLQSLALGGNGN